MLFEDVLNLLKGHRLDYLPLWNIQIKIFVQNLQLFQKANDVLDKVLFFHSFSVEFLDGVQPFSLHEIKVTLFGEFVIFYDLGTYQKSRTSREANTLNITVIILVLKIQMFILLGGNVFEPLFFLFNPFL